MSFATASTALIFLSPVFQDSAVCTNIPARTYDVHYGMADSRIGVACAYDAGHTVSLPADAA
jgi:hypothetical protein